MIYEFQGEIAVTQYVRCPLRMPSVVDCLLVLAEETLSVPGLMVPPPGYFLDGQRIAVVKLSLDFKRWYDKATVAGRFRAHAEEWTVADINREIY